jgi:uncharacterized damage-inducible protein DinB
MKQVNWFERNFEFNITQNVFPSVIERLEGTSWRLENKLASIPADILNTRIDDTWSIKENIGHLIDLEPLWQLRLEEIIRSARIMTAADLQNKITERANHNAKSLEELLKTFKYARTKTVAMLENIDETIIFKSALHPRLNKPMRTMDLFIFVAEHDDHHLARITEINKFLRANNN